VNRLALAVALVASLAGAGCSGDFGVDEAALEARRFDASPDKLRFSIAQSPSGSAAFDMCGLEEHGELDLSTAAWLTFFAGNEYAHFGYLGPLLNELGFGNPYGSTAAAEGGLDYLWEGCAIDLYDMRAFEAANKKELAARAQDPNALYARVALALDDWGACAHKWFDETDYDGTIYPAASFEKWLVQTARPGSYIQFFGGGKVKHGGSFFEEGSTQVMYMRHAKLPIAIISFRGTEPSKWLDIAADAFALQVPFQGWGLVHDGFYNAFESVRPMLDATLDELEGTGTRIYITGHSLGGGLATLLTSYVLQRMEDGDDLDLRAMYNVGSPRVGDLGFKLTFDHMAERHGVNVVRIRNGNDIVTHVPLVQDWWHVDQLVHLRANDLSLPWSEPFYWGLSVDDHDVGSYYGRLVARMRDPAYRDYLHCAR
jgi:lipase (class 3)